MKTAEQCQLPECSNQVEQPSGGGPRKRFCCDAHRLLYWRQTQKEHRQQQSAEQRSLLPSNASEVLALRDALESSVSTLEAQLTRARTALLELSSLEAAESTRKQAFAQAEEKVARAQAQQAAEERRRQAAESLAEAAAAQATELESQLHVSNLRQDELQVENEKLSQALEQQTARALEELAAAREQSQKAQDRLLTEVRSEIAARAKAEARSEAAETIIAELKAELAAMRGQPPTGEPAKAKSKKRRPGVT